MGTVPNSKGRDIVIHVFPDVVIADTTPFDTDAVFPGPSEFLQIMCDPINSFNDLQCHALGVRGSSQQWDPKVLEHVKRVYLWAMGGWERLLSLAWFVFTNSMATKDAPVMIVRSIKSLIRTRDVANAMAGARPFAIEELQFYERFWSMFVTPGVMRHVKQRIETVMPPTEPCTALPNAMGKFLTRIVDGVEVSYCQLDQMILLCAYKHRGCTVARVVSEVSTADSDFSEGMILRRIGSLLNADLLFLGKDRIAHFPANVVNVSESFAPTLFSEIGSQSSILHVPLSVGALTST